MELWGKAPPLNGTHRLWCPRGLRQQRPPAHPHPAPARTSPTGPHRQTSLRARPSQRPTPPSTPRTRGVRVAERGVQEDICQPAAPDVQRLVGDIREDDTGWVDPPGRRLGADARLAVGREAQQPEHRAGHAAQDVAPGGEGLRVVLVQLQGEGGCVCVCLHAWCVQVGVVVSGYVVC